MSVCWSVCHNFLKRQESYTSNAPIGALVISQYDLFSFLSQTISQYCIFFWIQSISKDNQTLQSQLKSLRSFFGKSGHHLYLQHSSHFQAFLTLLLRIIEYVTVKRDRTYFDHIIVYREAVRQGS